MAAEIDRESFDEGYATGYHDGFSDGFDRGYQRAKLEREDVEGWHGKARTS